MSQTDPTLTPYAGPDRRALADSHWSFKKEIQVSHIISTAILAITAMMYVQGMEKRISIMEEKLIAQRERDEKQDRTVADAIGHISNQVDRIDSKLDRLVERNAR